MELRHGLSPIPAKPITAWLWSTYVLHPSAFAAKGWQDAATASAELQAAGCRSERHGGGADTHWLGGRTEPLQRFSRSPLPCYDLGCRRFVRLCRGYTLPLRDRSWHHKMICKQHKKENKTPSSTKFSFFSSETFNMVENACISKPFPHLRYSDRRKELLPFLKGTINFQ